MSTLNSDSLALDELQEKIMCDEPTKEAENHLETAGIQVAVCFITYIITYL